MIATIHDIDELRRRLDAAEAANARMTSRIDDLARRGTGHRPPRRAASRLRDRDAAWREQLAAIRDDHTPGIA